VRGEDKIPRRYLVILPGTPDNHGAVVQVQREWRDPDAVRWHDLLQCVIPLMARSDGSANFRFGSEPEMQAETPRSEPSL